MGRYQMTVVRPIGVRAQASIHWLSPEQKLYKRSFSGSYLRCVHPRLVQNVLYKLDEGSYESHAGGRSLAHLARSQSYWWPYIQNDAVEYVKKCDKYKKHAHNTHMSATDLHPIISLWPFAMWGLDIIGPFPKGSGKKRFLLVETNYFTKWVKVVPLVNIEELMWKLFFGRIQSLGSAFLRPLSRITIQELENTRLL